MTAKNMFTKTQVAIISLIAALLVGGAIYFIITDLARIFLTQAPREVYVYTVTCNDSVVLSKEATFGHLDSHKGMYVIGRYSYTPMPGSVCDLSKATTGRYDNGETIQR